MNVNGRIYAVEKLPMMKVIAFVPEVLEAFGPSLGGIAAAFDDNASISDVVQKSFTAFQSAKVTAIMHKSLAQCITPENTYLKEAHIFETHFAQYPEDLFLLGALATWELVKDFLPRQVLTKASALASKVNQSQSPQDGK